MESGDTMVLVRYSLLADRADEARHELTQLVATVIREEPDCLGIEMLQRVGDPTKVALVERWTSREVYEGPHMQTPHLQSFISRASRFLAGPPDISFWREERVK
jgi:quinol monooxygenase YgiN